MLQSRGDMARPAVLIAALSAVLTFATAFAEPHSKKDWAEGVGKVGGQALKQWAAQSGAVIPPSNLTPEERSQLIEQRLAEYTALRGTFYSAKNAGEWAAIGVGGVFTAAALYLGPQAAVTVPVTLLGAAVVTTMEIGNDKIEEVGRQRAVEFLALHKDEILAEAGVNSYAELRANPQLIRLSATLFADIRERAEATNDPELINSAHDLMEDAVVSFDEAMLDGLTQLDDRVNEIEGNFEELVVQMDENQEEILGKLDQHSEAIEAFTGKVEELRTAISDIDERIAQQGRDQAFISDFVLDQMSPQRKVAALKGGFIAERFICPETEPTCGAPKLKDDLIARFEKQAELEETLGAATQVVAGLSNISTIAANLGIDSPELNQAVEIGNAALNAVTAWASGNPLGAIAAVTGLFGKKSNPEAERFQVMMRYLQQQFAQINAKLDQILKNQQVLLDAIVQVSEQLQRGFEAMDKRLARMEFEQERMAEGVRVLIWRDWANCYAVYASAIEKENDGTPKFLDPRTLRFQSYGDLKTVYNSAPGNFSQCITRVTADMATLSATKWFGNFIDARWALDERQVEDNTAPPLPDEWRSRLQSYEVDVFQPGHRLTSAYLQKQGITWSSALSLLATPSPDTVNSYAEIEFYRANQFKCFDAGRARDLRFYNLLCADAATPPDEKAVRLLERPILAEMTVEIADWILVLAQIADVYRDAQGVYADIDQLLEEADGVSRGRKMIEKSILVLDIAVAAYNEMYGALPALGVIDAIEVANAAPADASGEMARAAGRDAIVLLQRNSYLAENVATLLLEREFRRVSRAPEDPRPPPELSYRESYKFSEQANVEKGFMLAGMFGDKLTFGSDTEGAPTLHLAVGDVSIAVPLPGPDQFTNGRLVFPPRFYKLLDKRDQMVDRLADYDLLAGIDDLDKQAEYAVALLRR